jgi:hypothetical protein
MDIDFENLTDEMKEALGKNVSAFESATGRISFDPSKPLDRSDMEQLKISHKMDGEQREMSVWDTTQMASKGVAFDKHQRVNTANQKLADATTTIREFKQGDTLPDDATLELVAAAWGVDKAQIVAGLQGGAAEPDPEPNKDKGGKKVDAKDIQTDTQAFKDAVTKAVEEQFGDRLLSSKYHGQWVDGRISEDGDKLLAKEIQKVMEENPQLKKLRDDAGDDEQKKSVLASLTKIYVSTVDKQARGRIAQINSAGEGDIQDEIPGIVKDIVALTDPSDLMATIAPQPIIFKGASESDESVTILSKETPDKVEMGDPGYEEYEMQMMGRRAAELSAENA